MFRIIRVLLLIVNLALISSAALVSCASDEPEVEIDVDTPAESIERATDNAQDSIEEATEDLGESVEVE